MIKSIVFFIALLTSFLFGFGSLESKPSERLGYFNEHDQVDCFYNKKQTEPLVVYDTYMGKKVASLEDAGENAWYMLDIAEVKPNYWYKCCEIYVGPNSTQEALPSFKNKWVHTKGLHVSLENYDPNGDGVLRMYKLADINSRILFSHNGYEKGTFLDRNEDWVKVKLGTSINGPTLVGWVPCIMVCPLGWTTCPSVGCCD